MFLVFDSETTGFFHPRLVQLGWLLYDSNHNLVEEACHLVKPEGFSIPRSATAVHGISTQQARDEGISLEVVLNKFNESAKRAKVAIAHNFSYDDVVVKNEYRRCGMDYPLADLTKICTQKESTDYCKLPSSKGGYKWPKLSELHQTLFGREFDGAHNALEDARACANCFFELKNKGVLSIPQAIAIK